MTVAATFEKLFKPHFGGLKFLAHKDLFFGKITQLTATLALFRSNMATLRHKEAGLSICILGSDLLTKKSPIRSDPGVSDMDLDPIQIHKNRIFDPDRGSFRSDHYITGLSY